MSFKKICLLGSFLFVLPANAMDDQIIILQSLDNQKFQVEAGVLKLSQTLKNLLKDADIDVPLQLPNIRGATLGTILELLKIIKTEQNPLETQTKIQRKLSSLSADALVSVIAAANFLDIPSLLSAAIEIAKGMPIATMPPSLITLPKEIRNAILSDQTQRALGVQLITDSLVILGGAENAIPYKIRMVPNNERMVISFGDSLRLFDNRDKKKSKEIAFLPGVYTAFCITPDGSKILVKKRSEPKIRILDSTTFKPLGFLTVPSGSTVDALATNGCLVVGGAGISFFVWNMQNGTLLTHISLDKALADLGTNALAGGPEIVRSLFITGDGSRLIVGCSRVVLVWDLVSLKAIASFQGGGFISSTYLSSDERALFIATMHMIIKVNIDTKEKQSFKTNGSINSLSLTPDSNNIVGSDDRNIYIWDMHGIELQKFVGYYGHINALQVTADGKHIVSSSKDATLRIWEISIIESLLKNMSFEQAQKVYQYLKEGHRDGWRGIQAIFGLATPIDTSGAESETKKRKKE